MMSDGESFNDESAMLTVAEVAARLAVSTRSVRRMCEDGRLADCVRHEVDGTWRIPITSVGRKGQPARPGQVVPRHGVDLEVHGALQATLDTVLAQLAQEQANSARYRDDAAEARVAERVALFKLEQAEAKLAKPKRRVSPDGASVPVAVLSDRRVRRTWWGGRRP